MIRLSSPPAPDSDGGLMNQIRIPVANAAIAKALPARLRAMVPRVCAHLDAGGSDPHRLLRLELCRLEGPLLPGEGLPGEPLARVLRAALRHRRGQLDLLPPGQSRRRGALARADAGRI